MTTTTYKTQVTCTTKTFHKSPHKRISHIGGYGWWLTQEQAVKAIFTKQYSFYTCIAGRTLDISIASYDGNPYLKTVVDSEHPEQLLSLPEFDEEGVLLVLRQNDIFLESFTEQELSQLLAEENLAVATLL